MENVCGVEWLFSPFGNTWQSSHNIFTTIEYFRHILQTARVSICCLGDNLNPTRSMMFTNTSSLSILMGIQVAYGACEHIPVYPEPALLKSQRLRHSKEGGLTREFSSNFKPTFYPCSFSPATPTLRGCIQLPLASSRPEREG